MSQYDFPPNLRDAQLALLRIRDECEECGRTLPRSDEPMDGSPSKEATPGYIEDEAARLAEYRNRVLELSTAVMTHPYWETLSGPDRAESRTALKHAHEPPAVEKTA
ncbi:hypothetical protein OHA98_20895 [Streptomyces sp. NBC_00654]|uniref:hypothetical protein n=1 Tax=Streptomyces sp. NBC_00654 TaxID=2975799 RepID=UPI0022511D73|nr:hypothetical protein [Streptomyces sp. NBC_00654]MCX4967187.1 hypothetical protein [Streptomyces sp. NBC_00654]